MAGSRDIARGKARSEDEKLEAADTQKMSGGHFFREAGSQSELARREPTQSETDCSDYFGITSFLPIFMDNNEY